MVPVHWPAMQLPKQTPQAQAAFHREQSIGLYS